MPPTATPADAIERLSPRRRELVELLAKGLTNDEIARALGISAGTVRTHVTAILSELDVTNRTEAAAAFIAWEARPTQVAAVLRRPAIAVLPLVAIGDAAHAPHVALGLTEDVASLFARWCWFPVIATSSTSDARSLGPTSRDVGVALGARFLVDGSVRVFGGTLRLSLHVDDVDTGHRLWTDQRDVPLDGLFAVQDEICQSMVAAAYPVLVSRTQAEIPHPRPATQLAAWELAHAGMALHARRDRTANAAALERFREALARDSSLALAHYGMGLVAYDAVLNQWAPKEEALSMLHAAGERCIEYAPHAAEGHYLLGRYFQSIGRWDRAIAPLEVSVGRNPSFALAPASLAQSLQIEGRTDEAMVRMKHAVRLGPRSFVVGIATLHFMLGAYGDALVEAEQALVARPGYAFARAIAAGSAYHVGDVARGREHVRHLLASSPGFVPDDFRKTFGEADAVERLAHALAALAEA